MDEIELENASLCSTYIPSVREYLEATNTYGLVLACGGALALLVTIMLFIDTLLYVLEHGSSRVKTHTTFVIAVYPIICLVSYFAILVPRFNLLSEAITQGIFMAAMYQLFCLFVSYCGGDTKLVKLVENNKLSMKVGPCCCWPCCMLPMYAVSKKTIKVLRMLVLQLAIVQCVVYCIFLVMWAESESLYQINYMYIQPIIIMSILFGIWGVAMTMNLLKEPLSPEFLLVPKFAILQMVLVLSKLQGLVTRCLVWFDKLPCHWPVTPMTYANLIHNSLMVVEMLMLGVLARKLYKRALPNLLKNLTDDSEEKTSKNNILGVDNFGYI